MGVEDGFGPRKTTSQFLGIVTYYHLYMQHCKIRVRTVDEESDYDSVSDDASSDGDTKKGYDYFRDDFTMFPGYFMKKQHGETFEFKLQFKLRYLVI